MGPRPGKLAKRAAWTGDEELPEGLVAQGLTTHEADQVVRHAAIQGNEEIVLGQRKIESLELQPAPVSQQLMSKPLAALETVHRDRGKLLQHPREIRFCLEHW